MQIIAQGGARMDLHPDIPSAAAYVRQVYELGVRYFDCARMYWNGQSEEAYGLGLQGVRKNVFRYALSQPSVQVAICGCGTVGQMEDNIRAVANFRKMTPEKCAAVRKRAIFGQGVYTGTTLEYWKKKAQVWCRPPSSVVWRRKPGRRIRLASVRAGFEWARRHDEEAEKEPS